MASPLSLMFYLPRDREVSSFTPCLGGMVSPGQKRLLLPRATRAVGRGRRSLARLHAEHTHSRPGSPTGVPGQLGTVPLARPARRSRPASPGRQRLSPSAGRTLARPGTLCGSPRRGRKAPTRPTWDPRQAGLAGYFLPRSFSLRSAGLYLAPAI